MKERCLAIKSKKNNIKHLFVIGMFVLSFLLTIGLAIVSFAIYYDRIVLDGKNIVVGKIELDENNTSNNTSFNINATNVIPGMEIISEDIQVSKTATSGNLYMRAKLSITATDISQEQQIWLDEFNAEVLNNIYNSNNYDWCLVDGYYYLMENDSLTTPKIIDDSSSYVLIKNGITVPLLMTQLENNAQKNMQLVVNIKFQAIQSANLLQTNLIGVSNYFNDIYGCDVVFPNL